LQSLQVNLTDPIGPEDAGGARGGRAALELKDDGELAPVEPIEMKKN
jgi:hypothetical protein